MALNELLTQLKANAARTQSRRNAAEQALISHLQTQPDMAPPSRGGRSSGGAITGGLNMKGIKQGKGSWPAVGERHQHTSGYDWAKWSGDINVPGSGDFGNPVRAYQGGVVSEVRRMKTSYGKHIRIKHPDGTSTLYAHLSKMKVKPGQRVKPGQFIGRVGNSGNSSGPHLHFEISGG